MIADRGLAEIALVCNGCDVDAAKAGAVASSATSADAAAQARWSRIAYGDLPGVAVIEGLISVGTGRVMHDTESDVVHVTSESRTDGVVSNRCPVPLEASTLLA